MNVWMVACLGNMVQELFMTRHNFGFMFADYVANDWGLPFSDAGKYLFIEKDMYGSRVIVMKPKTYMNLSGDVIEYVAKKKCIPPESIILVYDDLDIPFGKIKVKKGGSSAGHRGVESVLSRMGTTNIPRIRLGIGPKPPNTSGVEYVLGKWTDEEMKHIPEILNKAKQSLELIIKYGIEKAMSLYTQ